tara:strand:- start:8 stop:625 length:618 start_codon:yes stop_codon:yes gene_type:complete
MQKWGLDVINREVDELNSSCIELETLYEYSVKKITNVFQQEFPSKCFTNELAHFVLFYQAMTSSVVGKLLNQKNRYSQISFIDKKVMFEDSFRSELWDISLKNIRLTSRTSRVIPLVENEGNTSKTELKLVSTIPQMNEKKSLSMRPTAVNSIVHNPKEGSNDVSSIKCHSLKNPPAIQPVARNDGIKQVSALETIPYDPRKEER